jgi:hypothetical protein
MLPLFARLPHLAATETRVATIQNHPTLPAGEYGFIELYCTDKKCDCRRVMINVMVQHSGAKVWATLNYGWESVDFYAKWCGDKELAQDMAGVHLDPLNSQSVYSRELLELFEYMIADKTYVERLKRHYQLFRNANSKIR